MNSITGIILAGGKNSRFGTDKALLKLGNKTIVEIIAGQLKKVFNEILIIANEPDKYFFTGYEIFRDVYLDKGPLAGIHSGLLHSNTARNFFISCDLPLMKKEMIEYLVAYKTEKPVLLPEDDGKVNYLCGVYNKNCLNKTEELLKNVHNTKKTGPSMHHFISQIDAEIIKVDSLTFYSENIFFNLNTYDDYEYLINNFRLNI